MHWQTAKKIGTGEGIALVAEEWFAFWRAVVVTALFHAAAEKTGHWALIAIKWVCYALLFMLAQYKIQKLIWTLWPSADPSKKTAQVPRMMFAVWITSILMLGVYLGTFHAVNAFIAVKGP